MTLHQEWLWIIMGVYCCRDTKKMRLRARTKNGCLSHYMDTCTHSSPTQINTPKKPTGRSERNRCMLGDLYNQLRDQLQLVRVQANTHTHPSNLQAEV